jgi:hypothetical protein
MFERLERVAGRKCVCRSRDEGVHGRRLQPRRQRFVVTQRRVVQPARLRERVVTRRAETTEFRSAGDPLVPTPFTMGPPPTRRPPAPDMATDCLVGKPPRLRVIRGHCQPKSRRVCRRFSNPEATFGSSNAVANHGSSPGSRSPRLWRPCDSGAR